MKRHIEKKHESIKAQGLQYTCSICAFESDYLASIWKHLMDEHPGEKIELNSNVKQDILINLVAEQNVDIMTDIRSLTSTVMEAFLNLAGGMEESFRNLKGEIKQEVVNGNSEIKTLVHNLETEFRHHVADTKKEDEQKDI